MKTLAIDFDGVIHSYTTPWEGPTIIPDSPVPNSLEFLRQATERYNVVIFSSRCQYPDAIREMKAWLIDWADGNSDFVEKLTFTNIKPPAQLFIDDRALTFEGIFPSFKDIDNFKPWNKTINLWREECDRKTDIILELASLANELYSLRGEDEVVAEICQQMFNIAEK